MAMLAYKFPIAVNIGDAGHRQWAANATQRKLSALTGQQQDRHGTTGPQESSTWLWALRSGLRQRPLQLPVVVEAFTRLAAGGVRRALDGMRRAPVRRDGARWFARGKP